MRIGVPNESRGDEALVATTPDTVEKLIKLGYEVVVESGAGERASYPDQQYQDAGATVTSRDEVWKSDIVVALDTPHEEELNLMVQGATLISRLAPKRNAHTIEALSSRGLTGLSMDMVPRISRAQSMDVLSSMANLAGYRAVIEAAHAYGRLFAGQVTAAGKMPPANVYVIGAGVAGLAAIGTAHSMGAQVFATDVRDETAEQVESMGGTFVPIPVAGQKSDDGYAKEMTQDQARAANELYAQQAATADIVITTANIPGRTSPILLDDVAVAAMKPGSVIVDMAAANGGNVTLTQSGESIVTPNGVTIIGYSDLAGRLPAQASQLYGQNIVNFFTLTTPQKDGVLNLDLNDDIVRQMAVTVEGNVYFPPPPVKVSAAPVVKPAPPSAPVVEPEPQSWMKRYWWTAIPALILAGIIYAAPAAIASHFMVFALAVVVGFYVITNVTHSLHTPLMSVTNAISGIIVVGAIVQIGSDNFAVQILAAIAVALASINVFGGFAVTERMLKMFRRS